MSLKILGQNAVKAERLLALYSTEKKNRALLAMADALEDNVSTLLKANEQDIENGKRSGLSDALLDRLMLNDARVKSMADGLRKVALLPDPVGRILRDDRFANGIHVRKESVPIGVIAIIFESRPNVSADSAGLCLKSGNAVILRGGKEALLSNRAIVDTMRGALCDSEVDPDCIQLITDTSRETAAELMRLREYVDLLIPRGGSGLIQAVVRNASVPVIETGAGTCHTYIDRDADFEMAVKILVNAKCSRPSVCNACESVLVHREIAAQVLPILTRALIERGVEIRGDEETCNLIPEAIPAAQEDWGTEFNDFILTAKVVADVGEAISHINRFGTKHSECIVTENESNAIRFMNEVDAAAVYHNVSTRFTDGGEFGLGAEIGISTQKLHVRGPIGLEELTSMKYKLTGNGQVRE